MTDNQVTWIFSKTQEFFLKWNKLIPLCDNQWVEVHDEMIDLNEKARGNKLMQELLLGSLLELERLHREKERQSDEQ